MARKLPKRLEQHAEHGEVVDNALTIEGNSTRLFASDSTGREWNLSKARLERLNESLASARKKAGNS